MVKETVDSISVVVPIFNEVENVAHLYEALEAALPGTGRPYEMIFVDDGSRDGSLQALRKLADADPRVKVIELRSNFGQTAALSAGIQAARGAAIVTMDGDMQNDPTDIPMMIAKLEEGYDLVHGWRRERQDALVNRKIPSRIANWLISTSTGFPVHDLGCTLKAIRRDIAQELELYGEMHRFIPILAGWRGARCVEVVTKHHPRRFGTSKYGISRTVRVLLDLITVKFLVQYLVSPMKLFGSIGLVCGLVSSLAGAVMVFMKFAQGIDMTGNPLLLLTVFSAMVGTQFVAVGMLAELGSRMYYAVQSRQAHPVRRRINFDHPLTTDEEGTLTIPKAA